MSHTTLPAPTFHQRGFTLVELAIVMFIVALLLGGMLLPLSAQQDVRSYGDTQKLLNDARDALLGYVVVNSRLPCPDTDNDGAENRPSGICSAQEGDFPYQTVGTDRSDGWGFRLRYRVSAAFTNQSSPITLASVGDIAVVTRGDDITTVGTIESKTENGLATSPAIIISTGKNGFGGLARDGGTRIPAPNMGTDEYLNYIGNKKVSRTQTSPSSGCADNADDENVALCEFDDQVLWLSANTIVNRLVASGRLP